MPTRKVGAALNGAGKHGPQGGFRVLDDGRGVLVVGDAAGTEDGNVHGVQG